MVEKIKTITSHCLMLGTMLGGCHGTPRLNVAHLEEGAEEHRFSTSLTQAGQERKPRQVASELASSLLPASSVRIWQGYGGEKDSTPR